MIDELFKDIVDKFIKESEDILNKMLRDKILRSFKDKLGKEVENLDLIVSIDPEIWLEDNSCEILENKDNGRVWNIKCSKNGIVKEVYEL